MDKIIVIAPKQEFGNIRFLISGIAQRAVDVLLIDSKESPDYEEIIKDANAKLVCTLDDSNIEEKLKKSIEEFNKVIEFKNLSHVSDLMDSKSLIDTTPRYDKFLKKWKKSNHWWDKSKFKKKWNKGN